MGEPLPLRVILDVALQAVAIRRKGGPAHRMTMRAGSQAGFRRPVGRLLIVERRAGLGKDVGVANAAIAAHALIVSFVVESDVAVGGFEKNGVRGGAGISGLCFRGRSRAGGFYFGPLRRQWGFRLDLGSSNKPDRGANE